MSRRAYIFPTDRAWFDFLSTTGPHQEVNFWTPRPWGRGRFGILAPGDLLLFRLKSPVNMIAGGGIFAVYREASLHEAWETFGIGNGVSDLPTLERSIGRLRRGSASPGNQRIGCIVLTDPFFWPQEKWFAVPADYPLNAVRGRGYDLQVGTGQALWNMLLQRYPASTPGEPPVLRERPVNPIPGGYGDPIPRRPRLGQGAFRLVVEDAYRKQCAVTGERALPALDAAHIRPFHASEAHDPRNGILLRSDIHRLLDAGYLTITPEHKVRVSRRMAADFNHEGSYLGLDGVSIYLPESPRLRPDPEVLEWHYRSVFLQ
jgi:putative restriction endonuclease